MRAKGYKCSNVKCDSCVAHCMCGEPADIALGCASRLVNNPTNADRIRAMSDEELAKHFSSMICDINEGVEYHENPNIWLEWLKQPAE